ncbi:hypothetical protein [Methylobacterium sp. SyP6R]|uniref:hypothetical protein n=1 Tax=Methylobacterium sp. SyP6R TaxID=2718876 RepID=UPI001F2E2918|nr:hypothetical protein [Methylobacterium sp. SyP6R]MCF4130270.1 hypothetical protein [Methylobacterium sp. SyP6R]
MTQYSDPLSEHRRALGTLSFGQAPDDWFDILASKYPDFDPPLLHRKIAKDKNFLSVILSDISGHKDVNIPKNALDIDKEIRFLFSPQERKPEKVGANLKEVYVIDPPVIRGDLELRQVGIECPYKFARDSLVSAIVEADQDTEQYYFEREYANNGMRDPLNTLRIAKGALEDVLYKHSARIAYELKNRERITDTESEINYFNPLFYAIGLIDSLETEFSDVVLSKKNGKPPDVWEKSYVERMGYAWHRLTKRHPGNNKPFRDFLKSGLKSVYTAYNKKYEIEGMKWESYIKYVVDRVRKGRGWDYFEPEGVLRRSLPEHDNFQVQGWSDRYGFLYLSRQQIETNKCAADPSEIVKPYPCSLPPMIYRIPFHFPNHHERKPYKSRKPRAPGTPPTSRGGR